MADILNAIYDAALAPARWQTVLRDIARLVDAEDCFILFHDQMDLTRSVVFSSESAADQTSSLTSISIDDEIHRLRSSSGHPVEIVDHSRICLLQTEHLSAIFGARRSPKEPLLSNEALSLIDDLRPHLARAIYIHNRLSESRSKDAGLIAALKHTSAGILLLDSNMHVVFSSLAALRILKNHPAITINSNGNLRAARGDEQKQLNLLMRQLSEPQFISAYTGIQSFHLAMHHERRSHPLKLTVLPLRGISTSLLPPEERIRLVIFLADPEQSFVVHRDYMLQTYELTATETLVAQHLLDGSTVADIAQCRGTSPDTTRWQVKQILRKTKTASQVELVRLLAALSMEFPLTID